MRRRKSRIDDVRLKMRSVRRLRSRLRYNGRKWERKCLGRNDRVSPMRDRIKLNWAGLGGLVIQLLAILCQDSRTGWIHGRLSMGLIQCGLCIIWLCYRVVLGFGLCVLYSLRLHASSFDIHYVGVGFKAHFSKYWHFNSECYYLPVSSLVMSNWVVTVVELAKAGPQCIRSK